MAKFIPNLANTTHPLNKLLLADMKWKVYSKLSTHHPPLSKLFQADKKWKWSAEICTHTDPSLPIQMAADGSAYEVGAVISHTFPDGMKTPTAFASCTLRVSEKNYAQLETEALLLVYGVRKFHQYLYGRRFTLITDYMLTTILGHKKGIHVLSLAAAHLQCWAILLSAYDYAIQYKSTNNHCNAESLSGLPLP